MVLQKGRLDGFGVHQMHIVELLVGVKEEVVEGNQKCLVYAKGYAGSMGAVTFEGMRTIT
jgi:hypothetical protein